MPPHSLLHARILHCTCVHSPLCMPALSSLWPGLTQCPHSLIACVCSTNRVHAPPVLQVLDARIAQRSSGELRFLDGESYHGLFTLSKVHRKTLAEEKRVLSRERGTFATMHSQGLCVAGSAGNAALMQFTCALGGASVDQGVRVVLSLIHI